MSTSHIIELRTKISSATGQQKAWPGAPLAAGVLYPFTGWLLSPMIAALAMSLSKQPVGGIECVAVESHRVKI